MEKALLILFGGRSMPNILTLIHEKPTLVVAIVSKNQTNKVVQLEETVDELFKNESVKPELDTSYVVDAFKVNEIYQQCLKAIEDHPGFDWIFNVTSATTIMSIGAYEAAKTLTSQDIPIRCWYLDTLHTNVVALIGQGRDENIFNIGVNQYAAVYNCRLVSGQLEEQRQYCQDHWIPFTQFLVKNSQYIDLLKKILKHIQPMPSKKGGPRNYPISHLTPDKEILLKTAYECGLLEQFQINGDTATIKLTYTQANFLNGPWLEAYVWNEAKELGIFSDYQWNLKVVDSKKPDDNENRNELDVSLIYHAQLLVAECKTGEVTFSNDTLYKFDSVTNLLGGRFVSKMLITSLPGTEVKKDFEERADERGILIVRREQLGNIREILEKQAKYPKQARI